jgi:hypothetical protein
MDEVIGVIAVLLFFAWLISALLNHLSRSRVLKAQIGFRGKILEKIGAGQEMIDFMASDAGQRMLEPLPVGAQEAPKEYGRILRAVQAGTVLTLLGVGIVITSINLGGEQEATAVGGIVTALGFGFLLAGAASYVLSQKWGLLNGRAEAE